MKYFFPLTVGMLLLMACARNHPVVKTEKEESELQIYHDILEDRFRFRALLFLWDSPIDPLLDGLAIGKSDADGIRYKVDHLKRRLFIDTVPLPILYLNTEVDESIRRELFRGPASMDTTQKYFMAFRNLLATQHELEDSFRYRHAPDSLLYLPYKRFNLSIDDQVAGRHKDIRFGLVTMSVVILNKTRDTAMYYETFECRRWCGSGSFIIVAKDNGYWSQIDEDRVWSE